jgi:hypothetical protein
MNPYAPAKPVPPTFPPEPIYCLTEDFDAALDGTAKLEVVAVRLELDARRHLGDGIDIFQNVPQADEVRPLDHSKHPNRHSIVPGGFQVTS